MSELFDPWSPPAAAPPPSRPGAARWVSAVVVGSAAVAAQVWPLGPSGPAAAWRIALGSILMVALAATVRRPFGLPLALVAGGAVMATSVPLEGRAPAALAFWLTGLAVVGVRRRQSVGAPAAGAALLLLLGLVGVAWWWTASLQVAVAGLLLAAGVLVVSVLRPSAVAVADRAVDGVVHLVSHAVELAVLAVVAVPLVVLPVRVAHLIRTQWRRVRPPSSTWVERSVDPRDERRDATGMWLPVPPRRRRTRNLAGLLLVGALVAGVLVVRREDAPDLHAPSAALGGPRPVDGAEPPTFRLSSVPAFADVPWADQIQAEHETFGSQHLPRDDELGYVAGDFAGRYTHSADGARRTYRAACAGCRSVRVWWFGGSAAWGWLQRDDRTVPSELARLAAADGVDLRVRNMGVPGWTVWQEYELFRRELARTDAPPDVAVFYDGFNDAAAGVVEASRLGALDPSPHTLLDGTNFDAYGRDPRPLAPAGGPRAVGVATAQKYLQVVDDIERVADGSGVRVVLVEQVDAFVSTSQLEFVRGVTRSDPATVQASDMAQAFDAFEQTVTPRVVPLRRSVAAEVRPVFVDPAHTNELGASLVAADLYRRLRPVLAGKK